VQKQLIPVTIQVYELFVIAAFVVLLLLPPPPAAPPLILILFIIIIIIESRYSVWLRTGRPRGRNSSPGRVKSFLHVVQTGSGAHKASYPMGTVRYFPGVKAVGA
jgi:hypothetical protein